MSLVTRLSVGDAVFESDISYYSTPIGRPSFVRKPARFDPLPALSHSLEIDPKKRSYKQQYANVYFIRLTLLKSRTVNRARERWSELEGELDF